MQKPGHSLHLCTGLKKWCQLTASSPVVLGDMQVACVCPQDTASRQVLY